MLRQATENTADNPSAKDVTTQLREKPTTEGVAHTIHVQAERILFRSTESGYTVFRGRMDGRSDPVTFVGTFPFSVLGESLEVEGAFVLHPKFGEQFAISSYTRESTPSSETEELLVQIEAIIYYDEESGYAVVKARVQDSSALVTLFGTLANPMVGEQLKVRGNWVVHPKFGSQLRIEQYEPVAPTTLQGIERYLSSGLIKGIGPVMAKRIVAQFGLETLEIIEKDPMQLRKVQGVGENRITMIQQAWLAQKDLRQVMVFLQTYGVSVAYATRIFRQYGSHAIAIVQDNPYRLAYDISGIGFVTADRIAENLGFAKESPLRAEAGILFVLYELTNEGHVFYPVDELLKRAAALLEITATEILRAALGRLEVEERIVLEQIPREGSKVLVAYLTRYHKAEVDAAEKLCRLLVHPQTLPQISINRALAWAESESGLKLAAKQRLAVQEALEQKVLVITGGPGTGKSTLLNVVLLIAQTVTKEICLAAPTGRAAKRMTELTGREAKTIHRLLCYDFHEGGFKKNASDPLTCDLMVLDEVSMVDVLLFYHLLSALPDSAKLLLVGDVNQLPSVGAGAVLQDLIGSGCIPVVRLTEIFRQARESSIVTNAHKIVQGLPLTFENRVNDDMFMLHVAEPEAIVETIVGLVTKRLPARYGYNPVQDIQVLSPMNRGLVGTTKLNEVLQEALNPNGMQLSRGSRTLRVGDKVMQVKNNYDKEVFNGDIGIISSIDAEEQLLWVEYDEKKVSYDFSELDELILAYAISIHKSQGGEYPVVLLPVTTQHYIMLQRNLLYTGVTRGKKLVVLVGTDKALALALKNTREMLRYSGLEYRLQLLLAKSSENAL